MQCAFVVDGGTQDSIEQDSNFKFQDHSHSIHWSKKLSAKGKKKKSTLTLGQSLGRSSTERY